MIDSLIDELVLERTGPAEATVGMISLPVPRDLAGRVRIDHPESAMHPVGWWRRHDLPRRLLAWVMDDAGVPEQLRLIAAPPAPSEPSGQWQFRLQPTITREAYTRHDFSKISQLRGVPADESFFDHALPKLLCLQKPSIYRPYP